MPAWVARPRLMPWCQQGLPHCGSPGGDGETLAGAVLRGWGTSLLLVPLQICGCSCPSPVVKRQRDNSPRPRRCCRTSTHDGISRKLWGRAGKWGEGWHRQGRSRPFGSRGIWEVRSQDNLGSACGSTLELVQCRVLWFRDDGCHQSGMDSWGAVGHSSPCHSGNVHAAHFSSGLAQHFQISSCRQVKS